MAQYPRYIPIAATSIEVPIGSPISVGQPASTSNQLIIGPPAGQAWRILSVRSVYTCDATVGQRQLVASFTSAAAGDVWSFAAGTVAQKSNVIEVSGGNSGSPGQVNSGATNGGEGLTQVVSFSWPDCWITSDVTLRIWMFFGYGPGDIFSDANVLVEEYPL